ncbi:MAG: Transcriptional regulator, AcrR family, partial [uncultured Ramlibacter sp.]
ARNDRARLPHARASQPIARGHGSCGGRQGLRRHDHRRHRARGQRVAPDVLRTLRQQVRLPDRAVRSCQPQRAEGPARCHRSRACLADPARACIGCLPRWTGGQPGADAHVVRRDPGPGTNRPRITPASQPGDRLVHAQRGQRVVRRRTAVAAHGDGGRGWHQRAGARVHRAGPGGPARRLGRHGCAAGAGGHRQGRM